jgi:hypothetical protein
MAQLEQIIPSALTSARSAILDAFAALEQETAEALRCLPSVACSEGATLGQKLEKLASLKASPSLSTACHKIIIELVAEAQALSEVRNDVVHSRMRLAVGQPETAIYLNTRAIQCQYPTGRVMNLAEHEALSSQTKDVTKRLGDWRRAPKK